jgi:hypothetical protein
MMSRRPPWSFPLCLGATRAPTLGATGSARSGCDCLPQCRDPPGPVSENGDLCAQWHPSASLPSWTRARSTSKTPQPAPLTPPARACHTAPPALSSLARPSVKQRFYRYVQGHCHQVEAAVNRLQELPEALQDRSSSSMVPHHHQQIAARRPTWTSSCTCIHHSSLDHRSRLHALGELHGPSLPPSCCSFLHK